MIFGLPDSAVSAWLWRRLLRRNAHLFSSYSYAFRDDRGPHHAVQFLKAELTARRRWYVVSFDFKSYFDSIDHSYLLGVLVNRFQLTKADLAVIEAFLGYAYADGEDAYSAGEFRLNSRGIPQGTSLSLFLANVACWELDLDLERLGARFARYADDSVVLCDTLAKAHAVVEAFLVHSGRSGAEINFNKSAGIQILSPEPDPELPSSPGLHFVGHILRPDGTGLAPPTVARFKRRVAVVINDHLLIQPGRGIIKPTRLGEGGIDWDLVTCINELRRMIYGGLSECDLRNALAGSAPLRVTRGFLAYYPLTDASVTLQALQKLDGWLLNVLARGHSKRVKMLRMIGLQQRSISIDELKSATWYSSDLPNDVRVPSFVRAWAYVKKCAISKDLADFPASGYDYDGVA